MKHFFIMAVVGLLCAGQALAHNPLGEAGWCTSGAEPRVVAEFAWSGEDIRRADSAVCRLSKRALPPGEAQLCDIVPPSHGQFDDDWEDVTNRAQAHCADYAVDYANPASADWGTVVVIALGPGSYTDEDKHHELYKLDHGLNAACVRCQPVVRRAPVRRFR